MLQYCHLEIMAAFHGNVVGDEEANCLHQFKADLQHLNIFIFGENDENKVKRF